MVNDTLGNFMVYPSKQGGETFYLNSSASNLAIGGQGGSISSGSDASGPYFTLSQNSQVRLNARTSAGYSGGAIVKNHSQLDIDVGGRGYMHNPKDWRNAEQTAYFYVVPSSSDGFSMGLRGGRHTSSGYPDGCEGTPYKCGIGFGDGRVRIRKEQWHPSGYVSQEYKTGFGGSIRGRWVGVKFIVYDVKGTGPAHGTRQQVKIEIWIDRNATNQWVKADEYTDRGGWGSEGGECRGKSDQIINWAGPDALFRWDGLSGGGQVRFKKFSVREIEVGGTFEPTPPPPPPPPSSDTDVKLAVPSSAITADGNDGNVPANVNDSNLDTRWSKEGFPAWINLDMTTKKRLAIVKIAWYRGNERTMGFNIQTSDDNTTWSTKHTGSSAGNTLALESYNLNPDVECRYVRINVSSNSQSTFASITEIELHGGSPGGGGGGTTPPPPPPPPPNPTPSPNKVYSSVKLMWDVNFETVDICAGDE